MDPPQRANAAQLAARQLKQKPKGRLGPGRSATPLGPRPDPSLQFNPGQQQQNGGGLFGGSVQGAGTFNFTAPGGMSIPTPSFGSFGSNSTVSPVSDGEQQRFPGDDRATKRQFGGSATIQPKPTFQSNGFGQSQPNAFGNTSQPASNGSIFSFGGSAVAPTPAINFGGGSGSASNAFSFGGSTQAAPASPAINFGAGPTENKPISTPFAFGQSNAQPPASSSPFQFGSTATQDKPAAPQPQAPIGIFNFGASAAPEKPVASNSPFSFGSTTTQEKPATAPFAFGQNSAAPSSSGINFGSTATTAPPMSNIFGTSTSQASQPTSIFAPSTQPPSQAGSLFTTANAAPASKNGLFGNSNPGSAPANNLFGKSNAESAPNSNLFGSREQSPAPVPPPTSNLFGSQSQQPASASTSLFGVSTQPSSAPKAQEEKPAVSTGSIFSNLNKPAAPVTSNLFNSPKSQFPPSNNLFGKSNQTTTAKNIFGTLNTPVDDSVKEPSINSNGDAISKMNPSSLFAQPNNAAGLFGQSQPSNNENDGSGNASAKSAFSFVSTPSSSQSTNIFSSPMKPAAEPSSSNQPPPSGSFSRPSAPTQSPQKSFTPSSPQKPLAKPSMVNPEKSLQRIPDKDDDDRPLIPNVFEITHEQVAFYLPAGLNEYSRMSQICQFRLNCLNTGMADFFNAIGDFTDPSRILRQYMDARKMYLDEWNAYKAQHDGGVKSIGNSNKFPRQLGLPASVESSQSSTKRKLLEDEDQENENPEKRTKGQATPANAFSKPDCFGASSSSKLLQSASSPFKAAPTIGQTVSSSPSVVPTSSTPTSTFKPIASTFGQKASTALTPATSSTSKGKRKAEEQLTKDSTEEGRPLRQIKTPKLIGSTAGSTTSNTSNLFKDILDSPSKLNSPSKSPEKKMAPLPESKDEHSRLNPFGNLQVPGSPAKAAPLSIPAPASPVPAARTFPPSAFTPKNPSSLSNMFTAATPSTSDSAPNGISTSTNVSSTKPSAGTSPTSNNLFSPTPAANTPSTGVSATQPSPLKPPVFGAPKGDPMALFAQKAEEDKKKAEKKREDEMFDNEYDSEEDGDPEEWRTKYRAARKAELEELEALAKKPVQGSLFKPPVFGAPKGDPMALFAQKAEEDKKKAEKKREDEMFDNEYDSEEDGDPEEWRAKYRATRKAELEQLEALTKKSSQGFQFKPQADGTKSTSMPFNDTVASTVTPSNSKSIFAAKATFDGRGNSPAPVRSESPAQSSIEPKSIFGPASQPQTSGISAFSSANASRTSTPGLFGSSSGSVLDGAASSKPVTDFKNIFGKLNSGVAQTEDEADDDSAEEENDADEENKDPSYKPSDESASGPGTPSTPVEETGAGIASALKARPFGGFGTPKATTLFRASSGTTTPSGTPFGGLAATSSTPSVSIFDRIGKQPDPVPDQEKSGASTPVTRSLFDRMGTDASGKPVGKNVSVEEKENTQPSMTGSFGSSIFSKSAGAPVDNTWKPDSPIKFGGNTSAPSVSITAATPTKAPFSNLFGSKDPKPAPAASPFSGLFSASSTTKVPTPSGVGFSFGGPSAASSLLPSTAASANTSRATTPGATTDGESGVENDPDAEKHEQINLTAGGPGEEDEEVVLEVRAKALKFEEDRWITKGLGPLRVLKHKETSFTRILLRADPSGSIALNKGLLSGSNYVQNDKTVKIMVLADAGGALETYILQVKTADSAKKLAEVLEANKGAA